ncbi:MAG: general stress protein [bacterium]
MIRPINTEMNNIRKMSREDAGRKGGKANTAKQDKARRENIRKAQQARREMELSYTQDK